MRTKINWFIVALVAAAFTYAVLHFAHDPVNKSFFPTTPTNIGIVHVESSIWNTTTDTSINFLNRYTTTKMVRSHCGRSGSCIIIRFGNAPGRATAWTYHTSYGSLIVLERSINPRFRREILNHELGHAHGLSHASRCVSIMWPYSTCHGKLVPQTFTPAERAILRRH